MNFADVFLTCAAHSICFRALLWGAELTFLLLACPSCSLRWIRTRFSPLNCRGCCASLNVWGYKCLSHLLQDHPPFVLIIRHPGRVDLGPDHKDIVLGHNDVMEDDQVPAGSHPPAAVSSNHLVQVVHALSFVVVVDCWLPVLIISDLSCIVQHVQEGDIQLLLWEGKKLEWAIFDEKPSLPLVARCALTVNS